MRGERELAAIFNVLLFGVVWPGGCGRDEGDGYGGVCWTPYSRRVDPVALAGALKDGELSKAECVALCVNSTSDKPNPPQPEPTSGGVCEATTTSTDTGTDTGVGGSTTTGSTGETGTGMETGSTTDDCADVETTDPVDEIWIDESSVYDCSEIEGDVDGIYCGIIDCVAGRRPVGLRSAGRAVGTRALGRWFAEVAHLEAASVPAFERLAVALAEHGAPAELCRRALAAADDERRHATMMTTLAAEFGGAPATPELDETPVPTLLELARENAVEGCVGETWGALIARHQADASELPRVRAVMAAVAEDETEHAELAWAVDAWLETRLTATERAEVLAVRTAACEALRERLASSLDRPDLQSAGVPRRATALALHDGLSRALWSS